MIGIVTGAIGGAVGLLNAAKLYKTVPEGSLGLRYRLGKVVRNRDGTPKIIGPGKHWFFPLIHDLKIIHTEQRKATTKRLTIQLQDGSAYEVQVYMLYGVTVKGVYTLLCLMDDDKEEQINQQLEALVLSHVSKLDHYEDPDTVSADLLAKADQLRVAPYIKPLDLRVIEFAPTAITQWTVQTKTRVRAQADGVAEGQGLYPSLNGSLSKAIAADSQTPGMPFSASGPLNDNGLNGITSSPFG